VTDAVAGPNCCLLLVTVTFVVAPMVRPAGNRVDWRLTPFGKFFARQFDPSRHRHRNRQPDGRGREQGDIIAFSMLRSRENIRL
jgi:hypothetical protein